MGDVTFSGRSGLLRLFVNEDCLKHVSLYFGIVGMISYDDLRSILPAQTILPDTTYAGCRARSSRSTASHQHRSELTATCTRAGHTYDIALLDINIHADPKTSRLIAAYRRWTAYR